jgi:hypothetical protein
MPKRPKISDELHEEVLDIHKEYTGERAQGFEPALRTITQLAEAQILDRDGIDPNWYPGKYLKQVLSHIAEDKDRTTETKPVSDTGSSNQQTSQSIDPDTQAVFKTVLGEDGEVTIPEAEIRALDLDEGELLQIIAYSLADE